MIAVVGRFSFLLFCHVLGIPRRDKFAGVGVDEIYVDIFRDIAAYDAVGLAAGGENKHRHRITNSGLAGLGGGFYGKACVILVVVNGCKVGIILCANHTIQRGLDGISEIPSTIALCWSLLIT